MNKTLFDKIALDDRHHIYLSSKAELFRLDQASFQSLWNSHPEEFHEIRIHGKWIKTPRWQQAYGKNYRYTGSKNNALAITAELQPFLDWSRENIDTRLNGLLLNWYDGSRSHYIGAHRDDTRDLHPDSPIVTISIGQERVFRMRPWKQKGYKDLTIRHGDVVVVPWNTNTQWTHEVPHFKKYSGKRISITLRAYL
ncbi:MAG: alpha-ketoglutarate-dependent dioxygenase AlkB [Saprospiraceae bacterium]|nr:alpha-ketoglutarate-dependent dioxygenase AlkB [Saprospiraceae bacterium]